MKTAAWEGIETAPKTGTRFIGRTVEVERYTGKLRYSKRITW